MGRRMKMNESQLRNIVRAILGEQNLSGPKLGVSFDEPKRESRIIASDEEGSLVEGDNWAQDEDEAGYGDALGRHYDDMETYGPYDGDVMELPEDSEAYEDSEAEDMEEPDPDLTSAQYYDRRY
jgi:hypothetical protein